MRKTILTFAMMLMMAFIATAGQAVKVAPAASAGKAQVKFKGDTIIVNDGDEQVVVSGLPELKKMRDKINDALDDTLTAGNGTTVQIGSHKGDLSPEDIKEMSDQWASVVKQMFISGSFCLLGLVALVLFFRFLNRRNKYRVMEKAIENNYPLQDLSLTDVRRSAIYVQQPVVTTTPQQPGQVPVGTPIQGQTPQNPVVMTDMVNWRALMPAVKWLGWGALLVLFSIAVSDGDDPFWPVGLALIVVGLCKGFILYKEQQSLQGAMRRAQEQMSSREPMREGIAVPPAFDQDYKEDENEPYQPY